MDGYLEIENFAVVHRTLNTRALVIESENIAVLLSLELTSLPDEEVEALKKEIGECFGVKKDYIWICVTHTFSAPHLLPDHKLKTPECIAQREKYRESIKQASLEAVEEAFKRMQPVTAGFGSGYCGINSNRDVELLDGWWIGEKGPGLTDQTVSVMRFDDMQGKTVAILYHYAVQSSVLDGSALSAGGKAVTPDVAGVASDYIEMKYEEDETVGFFLLGAAGDQAPVEKAVNETFVQGQRIVKDRHEEGFLICERLGSQLGEAVCAIAEGIVCQEIPSAMEYGRVLFRVPGKAMERELKNLHPVKTMEYVSEEEREIAVEVFRLGDVALVGVKPELNCGTAVAIRMCSPVARTLVCTMVNGAAKYMADRASYDRFTYEAMNSPFGRGAAEILTSQVITLLENMTGES